MESIKLLILHTNFNHLNSNFFYFIRGLLFIVSYEVARLVLSVVDEGSIKPIPICILINRRSCTIIYKSYKINKTY